MTTPTHQLLYAVLMGNTLWMGWNLFLAVIPFVLALFLFQKKIRISLWWLLGFATFILFLPNTAYIFTDLIHLPRDLSILPTHKTELLTYLQYIIFTFIGYVLFAESYRLFEIFTVSRFKLHKNKSLKLGFRAFMLALVSFGVYLGRFLRFNSWDVLTKPHSLVNTVRLLNDTPVISFVAWFSLLLFLGVLFYEEFTRLRTSKSTNA